jgi:hypothetical protein
MVEAPLSAQRCGGRDVETAVQAVQGLDVLPARHLAEAGSRVRLDESAGSYAHRERRVTGGQGGHADDGFRLVPPSDQGLQRRADGSSASRKAVAA